MVTLTNSPSEINFGNDSIVIRKHISDLQGGRSLDVSSFKETSIQAGHVIITDGASVYKPMPVKVDTDGKLVYDTLPTGYSYCGILAKTILTTRPMASILTYGVVNDLAMPITINSIKTAFCSACPHIAFEHDEESI